MAEGYGLDIKYTAKKKPYLVARFGNKAVKIAEFDGETGVVLFLKLLHIYGSQEFERGVRRNANNENERTG